MRALLEPLYYWMFRRPQERYTLYSDSTRIYSLLIECILLFSLSRPILGAMYGHCTLLVAYTVDAVFCTFQYCHLLSSVQTSVLSTFSHR